ncbi:MAG: ferritin-like domain-containing protein [Polyangiaceae bacterium]|jgi:rubrerythrin
MGDVEAQPGSLKPIHIRATGVDTVLKPLHRWVWSDAHRCAHKLLRFAETEADGGRDIARAAELTGDALLRRLYLRHAMDELRHAEMFRTRGRTMLAVLPRQAAGAEGNWFAPGERGLDDLNVNAEKDDTLLAFLHLSERAAAMRFAVYREVLTKDRETREVFESILRDEAFHMNYTRKQLERVSPRRHGLRLWTARLHRLWKVYLRFAAAFASVMGAVILTVQYFLVLPVFAWAAKRAGRREAHGWTNAAGRTHSLGTQY